MQIDSLPTAVQLFPHQLGHSAQTVFTSLANHTPEAAKSVYKVSTLTGLVMLHKKFKADATVLRVGVAVTTPTDNTGLKSKGLLICASAPPHIPPSPQLNLPIRLNFHKSFSPSNTRGEIWSNVKTQLSHPLILTQSVSHIGHRSRYAVDRSASQFWRSLGESRAFVEPLIIISSSPILVYCRYHLGIETT